MKQASNLLELWRRSRTVQCFALLLAAWLALPSLVPAQQNASGLWRAARTRDDGSIDETYFRLKQTGSVIEGTVEMAWGDMIIRDGVVTGDRVVFQAGSLTYPWHYEGALRGDEMQLTLHDPNPHLGPITVIAQRVKTGGFGVPKRIEPPALKELPYNGLAKTPPMGWNSWNYFQGLVDDATVRAIADAMAANGMRDAGYVHVNIDDSWEGQRDENGTIHPNKKFPDMQALANYVHGKGLKLGIYSSPGPKTCSNYEGSYGHEEQDARTFAAWGIDYLKYDWCSAFRIYKDSEMRAVYQKMGEALEGSGRPTVFSLCQQGKEEVWKWGPLAGGNIWRTTGDIEDSWKSIAEIGFSQPSLSPYAAPGHWNDPDMLEIGNGGLTLEENRTHMTLWAMLAAPLIAGNDLRTMSSETLAILTNREVVAIDQDLLGQPARRAVRSAAIEIWVRPLSQGDVAVAVFNTADTPSTYSLRWSDFHLSMPTEVRNLWSHTRQSDAGMTLAGKLPAHGSLLLRLSGTSKALRDRTAPGYAHGE